MRAFLLDGGQAWIRTMEAQAQQIYSLSPLAARATPRKNVIRTIR